VIGAVLTVRFLRRLFRIDLAKEEAAWDATEGAKDKPVFFHVELTNKALSGRTIREIAEGDYEEIVENHVDADLDTVEKVAGYTKHHYEVFEFGFWAVEEKKSGNLTGVVGFRIPQDDGIGDVDYYVLSLDDENILDDTLELGYHIFPEYRRKGYAKEACRAAIEYAEEEFGTVQFIVRIGKENIVSKKVAESLGFVRTE
jgi:ribosomal-protein-alanine N-acetyltransferase